MKFPLLLAPLVLVVPLAVPLALAAEPLPLSLQVSESIQGDIQRIVLAFSRPVTYEIEETKVRYTLRLREPLDRDSLRDLAFEAGPVRRVRLDRSSRGAEITFVLREPEPHITLLEQSEPFQLDLTIRGSAAGRSVTPGETQDIPPGPDQEMPPETQPEPQEPPPPSLPDRLPKSSPGEVRNIVLDPGHGGSETGAVGASGLREKDLVLQIARRLRESLTSAGFRVLLTRDEDRGVDLMTRTAIANHAGADLFVSIHANASGSAVARGAETYYLSSGAPDAQAGSLAGRENGPAAPGPVSYPSEEIQLVLWEMAQSAQLARASRLAEMIQSELNSLSGLQDRGVRQAPFRVLVGATMPSVLLEVGFLSNPDEAQSLAQPDYQDRLCAAVTAAIRRFAESIKREDKAELGSWDPSEAGR